MSLINDLESSDVRDNS
ncbi:hypothetical protein D050_2746A, partial [Vibrio parahaemolyticus VPCR-2009]